MRFYRTHVPARHEQVHAPLSTSRLRVLSKHPAKSPQKAALRPIIEQVIAASTGTAPAAAQNDAARCPITSVP
jgi:hypothetical protein